MSNKRLTEDALIIAIYISLGLLLGAFSFGQIQVRIAEVLMVLCILKKDYILPLTLACLLTNVIGFSLGMNILPLDFVFGTLGTLFSGVLMYAFRKIKVFKKPVLSLLMPALINGLFVGFELCLYLNNFVVFGLNFIYIFGGEFISCTVLGCIFVEPIKNKLEQLDNN